MYFICIYDSLYYLMDIGTMWHYAFVSCTPTQSIGLFWGCALLWCWMPLCPSFTNSAITCYSIMIVAINICNSYVYCYSFWPTYLGFLKLGSFRSATTHLPGCFCPLTLFLNIGLNMLPSDSFMTCLDSLLEYSTGEFQALQVIVLAMFGAVN